MVILSYSVKAYIELRPARNIKGKKNSYYYISNKKLKKKKVGLLLNEVAYLVNNGHR